jgi:hypothetical protein
MAERKRQKQPPPKQQKQPEPVLPQITPPMQFMTPSKNDGHSSFSHLAKQAESLSNGDNSIMFNNYNNNIVFRSKRSDVNECLSIEAHTKSMKNVNEISFKDKSAIRGISSGYTINAQGAKIPVNDENIALSTAFGYDMLKRIEQLEARMKT